MQTLAFLRRTSYYIVLDYINLSTVKVKAPFCNSDSLPWHFECQRTYFSKVPKQLKCAEVHQKLKEPTNPCTESG